MHLLMRLIGVLLCLSGFVFETAYAASGQSVEWVQKAYIAYYGRPGDPAGVEYWSDRLDKSGGDLSSIIVAFGTSQEFTANYGALNMDQLIDRIYQQMFNRGPDAAGKQWYLGQLNSGAMVQQSIALNVLAGAQGNDLSIIKNKLEVATYFTAQLQLSGASYQRISEAQDLLSVVDGTTASVERAKLDCGVLMTSWKSNGGGGGSSASGTGIFSLSLTDSATDEYKAVYVTIASVQVHRGDGDTNWITLDTPNLPRTYNLLELVNGVMEQICQVPLEAGKYTQMRFYLGSDPDDKPNILNEGHLFPNYVIDIDDEIHELKVPSGYQSGIKLVRQFDIPEGSVPVELVLDFDAAASVVKAGKSGNYLLKPTIKIIEVASYAMVSGIVTDAGLPGADNGLAGAVVSAQIYDPNSVDEKDSVTVYTRTITADDVLTDGHYLMYLPASINNPTGKFNIVAYKTGYRPDCRSIATQLKGEYVLDFALDPLDITETGSVAGEVDIPGGNENSFATLSFRLESQCDDGLQEIEVDAVEVYQELYANNDVIPGSYSIPVLPVDTYKLVASSEGRTTQVINPLNVLPGPAVTIMNITFP